jgi:hypothetical protein
MLLCSIKKKLCIITSLRRSVTFSAMKLEVSNEFVLIVITCFLMFYHFISWRIDYLTIKFSFSDSTSDKTPVKSSHTFFSSHE